MVEDYSALVKKYASKFFMSSSIPKAELEQEGYALVLDAMASWDPSKGPLPPRVKYHLVCGLRDYARRHYTAQRYRSEDQDHGTDHQNPERLLLFKEAYQALSRDAIDALKLMKDEVDMSLPPKMIRGALKKAMRAHQYSWSQIYRVFNELKTIA